MKTLRDSKENLFKNEYDKLSYLEKFKYEVSKAYAPFECQKINDTHFIAKNIENRYIIFDVFENCGSIGSGEVPEFPAFDLAEKRIKVLNGKRMYKH